MQICRCSRVENLVSSNVRINEIFQIFSFVLLSFFDERKSRSFSNSSSCFEFVIALPISFPTDDSFESLY